MSVYFNCEKIALNSEAVTSYPKDPKAKTKKTGKADPKNLNKKNYVEARAVIDTSNASKKSPIDLVKNTPANTNNAVIPANAVSETQNAESVANGKSFDVDSKIKDKLLNMKIEPRKLNEEGFKKLKEDCKSDSIKNDLIKNMSYEEYLSKSKEFEEDVKAGLSGDHTISFEEMVLFGGNQYTREAWDAVSGANQDGIVDANEDDKLDLNDLEKNFDLVANYEAMNGAGSYTGQKKFIVVDINVVGDKAEIDGKKLGDLKAEDIKKVVDYLKSKNISMNLAGIDKKWMRILVYLNFAKSFGEDALGKDGLKFEYINRQLALVAGGKQPEQKQVAEEQGAPSKAAALSKAGEGSVSEEIKTVLQAHRQVELLEGRYIYNKKFQGTPEEIKEYKAELEKLEKFAKIDGNDGRVAHPKLDPSMKLSDFIKGHKDRIDLLEAPAPAASSGKPGEAVVQNSEAVTLVDKKSDAKVVDKAADAGEIKFPVQSQNQVAKILEMTKPPAFTGNKADVEKVKAELKKLEVYAAKTSDGVKNGAKAASYIFTNKSYTLDQFIAEQHRILASYGAPKPGAVKKPVVKNGKDKPAGGSNGNAQSNSGSTTKAPENAPKAKRLVIDRSVSERE